jgi:hypothetical protein
MSKDITLTKEPIRISKKQLIEERRIGLFIRAANMALKESGYPNIKFRSVVDAGYFSFNVVKVPDFKKHLV